MRFGKTILAAMILALTVTGAASFGANTSEELAETGAWVMKPVEKLSRGIANVAFGPLEILMKGWDVTQEEGGIAGITFGTLKGVSFCIAREVVGVVDIVTFLFPLPGCPEDPTDAGWGYGPIMYPAWVVDVKDNAFGFVFDDDVMVSPAY